MTGQEPDRSTGIDLRTALILMASLIVAIIVGLLTYVATRQWALAVLAGGAAVASSALFFDWFLKHE